MGAVPGRSTQSLAVMRTIVHGIAIAAAIVTYLILEDSIRTGRTSIFGAIVALGAVLSVVYGLIIVAIGAVGGVPLSKWPAIARQLFNRQGEA